MQRSEIGIDKHILQRQNLLKDGDAFPYGQIVDNPDLVKCYGDLETRFGLKNSVDKKEKHNQNNNRFKKGISLMPVTFGISFTKTPMNQARALVHVYSDGSIGVSTGAVEMGQGVNTKMLQIAC